MKSTTGWSTNGNGTNSSGFTGLSGGLCYIYMDFEGIGRYGNWWSTSEDADTNAWGRRLYDDNSNLDRDGRNRNVGFSVRCVKD